VPSWWERAKRSFFGTPEVARIDFRGRIGSAGGTSTPSIPSFVAGRQGIGTKTAARYGHPDALLPVTEIQRLFAGEWVPVTSTWIASLHWDSRTHSLTARLIKGSEYGGRTFVSPAELAAGASAPSKGQWLNKVWKRQR
jgi:hypothetical protein